MEDEEFMRRYEEFDEEEGENMDEFLERISLRLKK